MIYGSLFFKSLKGNQLNQYYILLFAPIALLIIFELFTLFFLRNRDKLIKEKELALTINNAAKDMLAESTLKGKIQIAIRAFKSILPICNACFMITKGGKTETIHIENPDEIEAFEKALSVNNDKFIIEKFKYGESLYCFIAKLERPLDDDEKEIYKKTFEYFSKIIENAISTDISKEESTESRIIAERYKTLHRLANELRVTWTYEDTYWKLADVALELFRAMSTSIIDVSGPQKDWHFVAFKNVSNALASRVEKRIKRSTAEENLKNLRAIKTTKSLNYIADVRDYPGWISMNDQTYSWIGLPIIVNDEVIAVLNVDGEKANQFDEVDLAFANAFSQTINDVFQKNLMLDEFNNLSITDPLTGLYNRREFDHRIREEVERAKRYKRPLTIMSMDLDRFKELNDTFGHLAGDSVLKIFGEILKKSVRHMDIAFRVGGDEFTIILPETEEEYGFSIAERIRNTLITSNIKPDFNPDVSIGVAKYNFEPLSTFLNRVDKALYRAKSEKEKKVQIAFD
jgi:diguanylate cyclase (GGDEF)-like protein